ncbi:MAG TPA: hypothetical protein DCL77_09705 [Prolixibacteraceae bacterium]|jgi:tetratricopeptide (TPR) repeat protein|nr:hypothetical protein [Prolixibacteraceae bacterium]
MTIQELHDSLYEKGRPKNLQLLMEIYESNLDLINKVDLTNLTEYSYVVQLTCDYAIVLENSGYFLKGLLYLDEAIDQLENFPKTQKELLFDIPSYELVLFHKARAFYNLKNYKDSQLTFDKLHKAFPDNDKYQGWIFRIKVKRYENWIGIGLGVMFCTLLLRTILSDKFPWINNVSYCILLLALVSTTTFEIGKLIKLKKLKQIDIL